MIQKYFDHKLGSQKDEINSEDVKLTKRILDAYIKEQPLEGVRENQRIGIKLEMKSYLQGGSKSTIQTGEFLNMLFEVYNINKSKFVEVIGYGNANANLHALLKGRRMFNSKLATIIGQIFKIEAEIWLYIETKNELKTYGLGNCIKLKKYSLREMSRDR